MRRTVLALLGIGILMNATPASALSNRTFVSGVGSDTNPCTRTSPCRTFQRAHDATSAGGEIAVLDAAGYGPVAINKAISIINDGAGEAGISQGSITINAGASDAISLRGITVNGQGASGNGIDFQSGGALDVLNCNVGGFVGTGGSSGNGIFIHPSGSTPVAVNIIDTIADNNANYGIGIAPASTGTLTMAVKRVVVTSNFNGFNLFAPVSSGGFNVTILDSVASNNGGHGLALGSNGPTATAIMTNSAVINNVVGVYADGVNGTLLLAGDTISGNTGGAFQTPASSVIESFGNNYIIGNPGGDGGTIPSVSMK